MLMEVQALCSPVPHGSGQPPMRMPSGVNRERLALLLAVLGKHTEMRPYSVDVHLNVTGGVCWGVSLCRRLPALLPAFFGLTHCSLFPSPPCRPGDERAGH
jgi:hypothetical protein